MKEIQVIIYMGIKDRFEKFLLDEKIEEFIVIPRVLGRLKGADPKLDTHVWPGYFLLYRFCMKDDFFDREFREKLIDMEKKWEKEGFMATVHDIEQRCGGVL